MVFVKVCIPDLFDVDLSGVQKAGRAIRLFEEVVRSLGVPGSPRQSGSQKRIVPTYPEGRRGALWLSIRT